MWFMRNGVIIQSSIYVESLIVAMSKGIPLIAYIIDI